MATHKRVRGPKGPHQFLMNYTKFDLQCSESKTLPKFRKDLSKEKKTVHTGLEIMCYCLQCGASIVIDFGDQDFCDACNEHRNWDSE